MKIVGKTLFGLEPVLAKELVQLGAKQVIPTLRAVEFDGDLKLLYQANLHCRTALSFLIPLFSFKSKNDKELYGNLKRFNWSQVMTVEHTFKVVPLVKSNYFRHSRYCALLTKDAIVDFFREQFGTRPDVSKQDAQLVIVIKIHKDEVSILLDSSGQSLNRRGYRIRQGPAPLNEVLAAGMILLSGWDMKQDFLDPMCGSGTVAIEAALLAAGIPPQVMRKSFAFQFWKDYDRDLWSQVRMDWEEKTPNVKVLARDASSSSITLSRSHAERIDVDQYIDFEILPFSETQSSEPLHIIMNPPYDERISIDNIKQEYQNIGTVLKHNFPGSQAWILSGHHEALKKIGLKPSKKLTLFNGPIECRYYGYELFSGTRKKHKQAMV